MRVLFDQGVPVPLRKSVPAEVVTCFEAGWSSLANGDLLAMAESEFDALVTTDKNIRYQQHLENRRIAILVLPTTRWPSLKSHAAAIGRAINKLKAKSYEEWEFSSE